MTALHPIPPNLFCVPAALVALTGADPYAVVLPALNRAQRNPGLLENVGAVSARTEGEAALAELGYACRRYRGAEPLGAQLRAWAKRSAARYHGRNLLVCVRGHALVLRDGRVYDTLAPHGPAGADHPCARQRVVYAAVVEKL